VSVKGDGTPPPEIPLPKPRPKDFIASAGGPDEAGSAKARP
jgi:hypothetical protein